MYFVGINIGQDVTTVSRSPGYNGAPVSQIALKPANNNEGKKIVSAVCRKNNQWSLVYGKQDYKLEDIREGFKGRISKMTARDKESMREFAKLIFATILKNDTDLEYNSPDDKNFELGIACPSDWIREDANSQQEYLNFFREECGVPVDFCMKEDDAIYYSRCERFNVDDSVLVIDIGTSVIDFSTYVKSKCVNECCWGINLGTHHIVDALLGHILKDSNNAENLQKLKEFRNFIGFDGDILAELSLYVQTEVEEFFLEERDSFTLFLTYDELTPRWPDWNYAIIFHASKDEFYKIISSYTSAVTNALSNTKNRLEQNRITPNRILLSGDESSMAFIREYAEQIFGVEVDIDPQLEWSISNGIALYMYHDSMFLDKFLAELNLGLIGITVLNIDYQKIDMAIGHALRKSLPYYIDSSSIDSKRNLNISSHLFLSNKDVNSILEERIMKYAIKVFREHMYFDVKY